MSMIVINPLSDSLMTNLESYQFYAYSLYPVIPYSFTLIMHWAHYQNIPLLANLIKEEMEYEQEDENDDNNNNNENVNNDDEFVHQHSESESRKLS